MLKEFPGGVWIDPDEIVLMQPRAAWSSGFEERPGYFRALVYVSLRAGAHHEFAVNQEQYPEGEKSIGWQQAYDAAEAWIREYLASRTPQPRRVQPVADVAEKFGLAEEQLHEPFYRQTGDLINIAPIYGQPSDRLIASEVRSTGPADGYTRTARFEGPGHHARATDYARWLHAGRPDQDEPIAFDRLLASITNPGRVARHWLERHERLFTPEIEQALRVLEAQATA